MKKILFLGAAPTQIPPIKYALEQGHYVITCDYLPENPGHALAQESYNISTTDKEAVLALAKKLNIDGIVAYASDPAAPTQAYVAEKMGLAGNPYKSVEILARKDLFRDFLAENGFNVPMSQSFYGLEGVADWIDEIGLPVFVKPVDSSGSKGVTRLDSISDLDKAFGHALHYSREKKVVVETEIPRVGRQIDSDIFMRNGNIVFFCWGDQHQNSNCNPYVPIAISFPSTLNNSLQKKAVDVVSELLNKLGFKSGAFNVELLIDSKDSIWILEIGPRNGGNKIPEAIRLATGIDMIAATVDNALGLSCDYIKQSSVVGYWSSFLVHSMVDGQFESLWLSSFIKNKLIEQDLWIRNGEKIKKYMGSDDTLGTMIIEYDSLESMNYFLNNTEKHISVIIKKPVNNFA